MEIVANRMSVFLVSLLCVLSYVGAVSGSDPFTVTTKSYSWVIGCPVMRVFDGEGEGWYYYEEANDSWRNEHNMLVLVNRHTYEVGPISSVTYDDRGIPRLGKKYKFTPAAECIISHEYCSTLNLKSESKCGSGLWRRQPNFYWTNEDYPGMKLRAKYDHNADSDRAFECFDDKGNKLDDSAQKMIKYSCVNDALIEGLKYGYNFVDDQAIYVVGKDSPLQYIEAANYRVFQMETPANGGDVIVYPYGGALYDSSVVKVTVVNPDERAVVYPMIRAAQHSFRLKLETGGCGETARRHRINILQVKLGSFTTHGGDMMATGIVPISAKESKHQFMIPFKQPPQMLSQVMDPVGGNYSAVRLWHLHPTDFHTKLVNEGGFSAAQSAKMGYVAMKLSGTSSVGFFGGNVMASAIAYGVTSDVKTIDWVREGYFGDVFAFVDAVTNFGEEPAIAVLKESSGTKFSFNLMEHCTDDNVHTMETISIVGFGRRFNPEDELLEVVPGSEIHCPYIHAAAGKCSGLFKGMHNFSEYHSVTNWDMKMKVNPDDGMQMCYIGDELVARGSIGQCVLSAKMCSRLTVLNTQCRGGYEYAGPGIWRGRSGFIIEHKGTLSDGTMHLVCTEGGRPLAMESLAYVCENDLIPGGARYGLNSINGEYVNVVGPRQMSAGSHYRFFSVESQNSAVIVYPLVRSWEYKETIIKATPHSTNGALTIARVWDVSGSTFRMELLTSDCKPDPQSERVNIMQVKEGVYTDLFGTRDLLAAGSMNFKGSFKAGYYLPSQGRNQKWQNTPTLFTQVLKVEYGPKNNFMYSYASQVTINNFLINTQGLTGQYDPAWAGRVGWIGLDVVSGRGHTLLGSMKYFPEVHTGVSPKWGYSVQSTKAFVEQPYVFAETVSNPAPSYAYLEESTPNSFSLRVGSDDCGKPNDMSQDVNTLVIGSTFRIPSEQDLRWSETRPGCAVMRAFQDCAGDYFPQYDGSYRDQALKKRLVWKTSKWQCCIESDYKEGVCHSVLSEGKELAECLTGDAVCEALDIAHPAYFGYWEQVNRHKYKRPGSDLYIRLKALNGRAFTAVVYKGNDDHEVGRLSAAEVKCLRPHEDNNPRGRGWVNQSGFLSYKVGDDFEEGPGVGVLPRFDNQAYAHGVVFYKYFQMEVEETKPEIYTHVGGGIWSGETLAFGTLFNNKQSSFVSFHHVHPHYFWVKHQASSCVKGAGSTRLNVLLIQAGKHESLDGSTRFSASSALTKDSAPLKFMFHEQARRPSVFTNVQGSSHGGLLNTRVSSVTSNSATVYVETQNKQKLSGVTTTIAMLAVQMDMVVHNSAFRIGKVGSMRAACAAPTSPMISSDAVNVGIEELQFRGAPFVLAQTSSNNGTETVSLKIDIVKEDSVQMRLTEDGCTDNVHGTEYWNMLLLGPSARRNADLSMAALLDAEVVTTTTTKATQPTVPPQTKPYPPTAAPTAAPPPPAVQTMPAAPPAPETKPAPPPAVQTMPAAPPAIDTIPAPALPPTVETMPAAPPALEMQTMPAPAPAPETMPIAPPPFEMQTMPAAPPAIDTIPAPALPPTVETMPAAPPAPETMPAPPPLEMQTMPAPPPPAIATLPAPAPETKPAPPPAPETMPAPPPAPETAPGGRPAKPMPAPANSPPLPLLPAGFPKVVAVAPQSEAGGRRRGA